MKILYVSASILPSHFANSIHVMKMSAALAENGNEVVLFGEKGEEEVDVYEFYNVKTLFELQLYKRGKLQFIRKLTKIIWLSRNKDVVYTRYTIAAFLCSYLLNKKVIYEYHGIMDSKINTFLENLLSRKKNVRHVFITHSLYNSYCDLRANLHKCDCIVLPDAADDPDIEFSVSPRKEPSIGYIGSFQPGKGVELVAELASRFPKNRFHIIGGKTDEVIKMKQLYSYSNIIWHGFLDQKEAMRILCNDIDIALLPNQRDILVGKNKTFNIGAYTSPMKLFEYMSYGKVIVASKLPVLEEVLSDGKNAFMACADEIDDWCRVIEKLRNNSEIREYVGKNAYLDFKMNYTWKSRAEKAMADIKLTK